MKRLYLSSDKKIAGVCAGIGEFYNIDPSIIRLLWVIVTVLTGMVPGAIAYIIVAWVVPKSPVIGSKG